MIADRCAIHVQMISLLMRFRDLIYNCTKKAYGSSGHPLENTSWKMQLDIGREKVLSKHHTNKSNSTLEHVACMFECSMECIVAGTQTSNLFHTLEYMDATPVGGER